MVPGAVREQIADPEHIAYVLERVEEEIAKLRSDLPDTLKLKEAELTAQRRRLANFVDFIGEGRGSQALAKALVETERRDDQLTDEVDALSRSREKIFRPPPVEWIKDRLNNVQQVLEQRTARSAQRLCNLLAPMRLELVTPDIGRPFYRAVTRLDPLALIEEPPPAGAEGGSNALQRWDSFQIPHHGQSRSFTRDVCTAARPRVYIEQQGDAILPLYSNTSSGAQGERIAIRPRSTRPRSPAKDVYAFLQLFFAKYHSFPVSHVAAESYGGPHAPQHWKGDS